MKFRQPPPDPHSNSAIIKKLNKLKSDFEAFNDKFVEYSRLYHMMKGRIHAEQAKIKKKFKKLVDLNVRKQSSNMGTNHVTSNTDLITVVGPNNQPLQVTTKNLLDGLT